MMAVAEETSFDDEEIKKTVQASGFLMKKLGPLCDDVSNALRAIHSCKSPSGSKEKSKLVTQFCLRLLEYRAICREHFVVMDKCRCVRFSSMF